MFGKHLDFEGAEDYLNNKLSKDQTERLKTHLDECTRCRETVAGVIDAEMAGEVRRSVFKDKEAALHPTDDDLIAYADETLGAKERKRLRGHLVECRTCLKELKAAYHLNDERIAGYINGSLDGPTRARTVRHIGRCTLCRWFVEIAEEIRAFRRGMPSAPKGEEIPVHLTEAEVTGYVWNRLDERDRREVEMHLSGIRGCRPCLKKIGEGMAERAIDELMGNEETRGLVEKLVKKGKVV